MSVIKYKDPVSGTWIPVGTAGSGSMTDEQVRDVVAAFIKPGTNVTVVHNDAADTLTLTSTAGGGGITTEDAVDAVAAALVAGNNIDVSYNDAANQIIIDVEQLDTGDIAGLAAALGAKADAGTVQPLDADLTTIANMNPGPNDSLMFIGSAWSNRTPVQFKTSLGLDQVNNTSDANKPISTAQQGALDSKADLATTNAALALKQPIDPDLTAIAGLTPAVGDTMQFIGTAWANRTPTQAKTTLALDQVNNTTDLNKPISTATQTALNLKFDKAGGTITGSTAFSAGVTMATTLGVTGAVTAASFTGIGTGLTALNASELQSGVLPIARFPTTIPSDTTGTAAAWTTARNLSFTGDVTGAGLVKGNADVSIALTVAPNSVALGPDTTGNFVAEIRGTTNQIISDNVVAGEGIIHTLSLPQSIHAAATPTFARLTLTAPPGNPPLVISSTAKVVNLNADFLDGLDSADLLAAGNLTGTIASARLTGPYTGITRVGTLDQLTVVGPSSFTGTTAFSQTPTVAGNLVWHAGNDGAGSAVDAGLLEGHRSAYFAVDAEVEALMGDLLAVGLYNAAAYAHNTATMPHPTWDRGPNVYWHNIYWIVASSGEVDFVDADYSGRYDVNVDSPIALANGDWIIAIDPQFGAPGHEAGTNQPLSQMVFQYIPFSTETYVKAQILAHASDVLDPHSAANYLKQTVAATLYSPIIHVHEAEISSYITAHEQKVDPHPQYLTQTEGDTLYLKPGVVLPYEPIGAVLAHEQKPDPHPQYLNAAEGNAAYSPVGHPHSEYALQGHTHVATDEVLSTDGAQSSRIYIGDDAPVNPGIGDIWLQTFDISLQPPPAPALLTISATTPTSLTVSWGPWDTTVAQSGVQVDRSPNGTTGWVQIFSDVIFPYATSYQDLSLAERTTYWYRVRAANLTGQGTYGTITGTTGNAPPNAPASLSVTGVSPAGFTLNWAAVTAPANDPMHATPYEVFKTGVSQGFTASTSWAFGGLTENTTISLGVRARDNLGVFSAVSAINGTTGNADPPAPTGLFTGGKNHYQVHTGWSAVSGIADFNRYQVFVNGGFWADVYTTNYLFSGLAPSTAYTFGVRSVDNDGAVSAISSYVDSTTVNPDTTPPPAATVTAFRPFNNYGEMYVQWTQYEATATTIAYRNINGNGWEEIYHGGLPAGNHSVYLGSFGAGTTIYTVVHQWDAAGNTRSGDVYGYTLVESPTNFGPHSSSSWRAPNGGQWNPAQTSKVYQGYASDPSLNSWGFWFYGTDFQNWWNPNRTITGASIFINREGCGVNAQDMVTLYVHPMLENPGNVAFWGTPTIAGGNDIGTVQYGEAKWMPVPVEWANSMMTGEWRGFAIARSSGKPYMCLYPSSQGYSGVVQISHLG
jgi:hypothetical protein